jgi:hypothetical protein
MKNEVALRKRSQIAQANRTMFIWIALASALIGIAAVVSIFLGQTLAYNERVLAAKQETVSNLDSNLAVVNDLKAEIQALDANSALLSVKANDSDQALQVVLDALPSDANSLALGSSLQNKLLAGVDGNFSLKTLEVKPVDGVETMTSGTTVDAAAAGEPIDNKIQFSFSVEGDQTALRQILQNLEKSIRTIVVTRLGLNTESGLLTMNVEGHAFYQPGKTIELKEVPIK